MPEKKPKTTATQTRKEPDLVISSETLREAHEKLLKPDVHFEVPAGGLKPDACKVGTVIMVGLSGSGKSRYLQHRFGPDARIASADNLPDLYREDGSMDFSKLSTAHHVCLREYASWCRLGLPVHCDNTNTNLQDIAPYIATAEAYGLHVEVVCPFLRSPSHVLFGKDFDRLAARNVHGVPADVIMRQYEQLKKLFLDWPSRWPEIQFPQADRETW